VPIAGHGERRPGGRLRYRGLVSNANGTEIARGEAEGPLADAAALGRAVSEQVLAAGGDRILARLRAEATAAASS